MFTIVVYEVKTRLVILVLPIVIKADGVVSQLDTIIKNGFDYEIYNDVEPVFEESQEGPKLKLHTICTKIRY